MAVNYVVVPKGNPADPNAPKTEEKFHPSFIKKSKVAFRSRMDLKEMLARFKYEKAK
jgi:hypothetical protein